MFLFGVGQFDGAFNESAQSFVGNVVGLHSCPTFIERGPILYGMNVTKDAGKYSVDLIGDVRDRLNAVVNEKLQV
jgi:hypothetical protein